MLTPLRWVADRDLPTNIALVVTVGQRRINPGWNSEIERLEPRESCQDGEERNEEISMSGHDGHGRQGFNELKVATQAIYNVDIT